MDEPRQTGIGFGAVQHLMAGTLRELIPGIEERLPPDTFRLVTGSLALRVATDLGAMLGADRSRVAEQVILDPDGGQFFADLIRFALPGARLAEIPPAGANTLILPGNLTIEKTEELSNG